MSRASPLNSQPSTLNQIGRLRRLGLAPAQTRAKGFASGLMLSPLALWPGRPSFSASPQAGQAVICFESSDQTGRHQSGEATSSPHPTPTTASPLGLRPDIESSGRTGHHSPLVLWPDRPSWLRASRSGGLFRSQASSTDRREMAASQPGAQPPTHPPERRPCSGLAPFHVPKGAGALSSGSLHTSRGIQIRSNKQLAGSGCAVQYTNR